MADAKKMQLFSFKYLALRYPIANVFLQKLRIVLTLVKKILQNPVSRHSTLILPHLNKPRYSHSIPREATPTSFTLRAATPA